MVSTVGALAADGYEIQVEHGALAEIGAWLVTAFPGSRAVVVTDDVVAGLHLGRLLAGFATAPLTLTVPPGEGEKNRVQWAALSDAMFDAGCGRDTVVVALGGGVVGDLAGFVAATYMRGLPLVQVPTTLLAMVDASVGGKTAVDVPAGKNLVGAFHSPVRVVADPDTLTTLPARDLRAGVAEMLKHGIIRDSGHLDAVVGAAAAAATTPHDGYVLAADLAPLTDLIADSIAIKAAVVREDPREAGLRRILNFGHTLGHAIESASGFALRHGEAVAIGMVLEAALAEQAGIAEAGFRAIVAEAVRRAGLPAVLPPVMSAGTVLPWMTLDKKARRGTPEFALPRRIGEMDEAGGRWSRAIEEAAIRAVLDG